MDEGSSDTGGMVSPVPGPSSGGMSPNPLASMPSPGGSPPIGKIIKTFSSGNTVIQEKSESVFAP